MSEPIRIEAPLTDDVVKKLKIGTEVLLSGVIYTARDTAHQRFVDMLAAGKPLPFDLKGSIIFYVGPSPAKPGKVIGAAGPTTSYRMDPFAPTLMKNGLKGMIGKGQRNKGVIDAMKEHVCVYFGATGGAAALIAKSIVEAQVIAFEELGAEAVTKLRVKDMPLIVANDCYGGDLYAEGCKKWARP
ncbi:MAG: Fe-S-containing hydro-lyase [Candidatus Riflebacteria bacterium]|nr:Fe-S-containing hydro-lyase [Candidatus Riflebacteria bacterium]